MNSVEQSCGALQKLQRNCDQFVDIPEKHHGNFAGTPAHKTGKRVLYPYSERPMNADVNKLILICYFTNLNVKDDFSSLFVICFTHFRETCVKSVFSCG